MSLRIRRGTDAQRTSLTFDLGELVWTTDSQKLYVGDGITAGGINAMATMAGTGFTFNPTTQRIDFSVPNLNLNTSEVSENIANLYFTDERAQDAVAAALLAGNAYNTGIAFSYNDVDNRITAVATGNQVPSISGNAGKYLTTDGTNIIWHNPPIPGGLSIPSFGGNQGKYLTTDGTNLAWANVAINTLTYSTYNVILDSSGNLTTSGDIKLPYGKDIKRDNGSGTFISVLGGLASINADLTPSLGGNLGLNGYNIGGTGNVNINGNIEATGTLKVHNTQIVGTLDVSTGLGADLTLNGHNIVGTGNINITGSLTTSGTIIATQGLGANLPLNGHTISGSGNIGITGGLTLNLTSDIQVRQSLDTIATTGYITSLVSRGTLIAPAAIHAGDELGGILLRAYTNGSKTGIAGIISFIVDPTAVIAGGDYVKSQVVLSAATDSSQDPANALVLTSDGVVTSNAHVATKYTQLAVYANDAARTTAIPTPVKGMMVFMTAGTAPTVTNKAVIYNGSSWALMPG